LAPKLKRQEPPAPRQPSGRENVIDGLRRQYDKLTQSQKRIAEYIVEHPDAVAFATVDQMATKVDVNPSTIVRFAYRLGLKGFPDLQERLRQVVRGRLTAVSDIVNENSFYGHLEGTAFGASIDKDLHNVRTAITTLKVQDFTTACNMLLAARRVYVAGSFAAFGAAHHLALALDRIRGDTTLLTADSGMVPSQSLELRANDCLVAITAAPYAIATQRVAELAREIGAKIIAVTDTPISAVGQIADIVLPVPSAGAGPQNSLVAPMVVANALLNGVASMSGQRTLDRYTRLNQLVNRWDTFLLRGDERNGDQ